MSYCDPDRLSEAVRFAMDVFSGSQREELEQNLDDDILPLVQKALTDYTSVQGLFDDAGVGEEMAQYAQHPHANADWQAFLTALETARGRSNSLSQH